MLNIANFSWFYYTCVKSLAAPDRTPMKTDMFSSLKVIHGVALSTAVSVAASVVIAAAFAAPVDAFAATATAAAAPAAKQ